MASITESTMDMKNDNNQKRNQIYRILLIVFLCGFVVSAGFVIRHYYLLARYEKQMRELQEQMQVRAEEQAGEQVAALEVPQEEPVTEEEAEPDIWERLGIVIPGKQIDFTVLKAEQNEDIYAWIYIPGTGVDYPVLQHPTDDSYYLERNIDGSKGYPGCIYSESVNQTDFSDPQTVLYGHNMKNGTMFATLHYFEDREFFDENRYIYLYTSETVYVYEIFAAYEYSNIHLIYNFDLQNKEIFQHYIDSIFKTKAMSANILEDMEVTADNRILTLSTCVKNKANNRYLVQGVLLNENE